MNYEFLCRTNEIPITGIIERKTERGPVAVMYSWPNKRHQQNFVEVLKTTCKHMGASLTARGKLCLTCPVHNFQNPESALRLTTSSIFGLQFLGIIPIDMDDILEMVGFDGELTLMGKLTTTGNFTRQMWIENTIDLDHVGYAHAGGFAYSINWQSAFRQARLFSGGNSVGWVPIPESAIRGLRKLATPREPVFMHAVIGPNLSITSFAGVFYSVERISEGSIETQFLYRPDRFDVMGRGKWVPRFFERLMAANRRILDEDAAMLATFDRTAYETGTLKVSDDRIRHHRNHFHKI